MSPIICRYWSRRAGSSMSTPKRAPKVCLLETRKKQNALIIMCTSMGQQALVVEAIQAGAKSFITKPFQPPKILETINKVLS